MPKPLTTPRGRPLAIAGDASLVTLDRLDAIGRRLDDDPRLVSVSLVGHDLVRSGWLRATAPAGPAIVMATDNDAIAGEIRDGAAADDVRTWATAASDRGLWHDWLIANDVDLLRGPVFLEVARTDLAERSSLSSSHAGLGDVRRRTETLTVAIDATWLGEHETGAQVLTVAAVEALAAQPGIAGITLTGIDELPAYAETLGALPKVQVTRTPHHADIAWYPNQVDARIDLSAARQLGRRVVVTYLDLIAYDISRYHASQGAWESYRSLQRNVALIADGITTISADVAQRLLEEVPRLDPTRVRPIPLGLDHVQAHDVPATQPDSLSGIGNRPFVLVLGNDFAHKNRDLAIKAWQELLRRGVACDLVLAGLHVRGSSSKAAEDALLGAHVDLRGRVHRLGHVSSAARAWLLAAASAVHYPTSAEGFGFVPYEAASLGTPATFTSFGPLREISELTDLPTDWSVQAHADDLERLLVDPTAAAARVADLRAVIAKRTWAGFADGLTSFFSEITARECSPASLVVSDTGESSKLAQVLGSRTYRIANRLQRIRAVAPRPRRKGNHGA